MSTLSPKERALLDAARKGWGPSPSASRAVRAGIASRLNADPTFGTDAPGPENVAASGTRLAAAKSFLRNPLGLASGVAVAGLCAFLVSRGERVESPKPTPVEATTSAGADATPMPAENAAPEIGTVSIESLPSATLEAPTKKPSLPAPGPQMTASAGRGFRDTLAEEVALVGAAQRSLRDGSPGEALRTLATHAARYPNGALREDRMALQVLASCAVGDLPKARTIRAELERLAPASSHLQRLSCAAQ